MNIWDIVILAVIAVMLFFAIKRILTNKKNCLGCSCGCAGNPACPVNGFKKAENNEGKT